LRLTLSRTSAAPYVAQTMPPMILSSVLSRLILLRCQQKLFVFVVEVLVEMLVAAAALARVDCCVVLFVKIVFFVVDFFVVMMQPALILISEY